MRGGGGGGGRGGGGGGGGGGGVNCLREVFENFLRFNKILCVNPEQESS